MNNSISSSFYDMRSFPDFVTNLAAESAKMYNTRQSYNGQGGYNLKFYNYYQQSTPYVSQMYGNCYQKQRFMPYPNRNNGGTGVGPGNGSASNPNHQSTLCPPQQHQQQQLQATSTNAISYCQLATNKSLNSSLNSSSYSDSGRNSTFYSSNNSGCSSPHQSSYSTDSVGGAGNSSGTAG